MAAAKYVWYKTQTVTTGTRPPLIASQYVYIFLLLFSVMKSILARLFKLHRAFVVTLTPALA